MKSPKTMAILGLMQYLSERLLATKTGRPRGEKEAHRESLAARQRARLLAATEQLMAERGCAGTTIERIAKRARVSSITFYDHFVSKEDAFAAALALAVMEERARLAAAAAPELPWPEQIREGLRALLAAIAARPERARVVLIESQNGGSELLAGYEAALDDVVAKLAEGRLHDGTAAGLPEALEETTAAGLAWLLRERLETDGAEGIEEMLPRLVDVALAPYLGSAEALHLVGAGGEG
jgi:AcrR family transcriptional regulator